MEGWNRRDNPETSKLARAICVSPVMLRRFWFGESKCPSTISEESWINARQPRYFCKAIRLRGLVSLDRASIHSSASDNKLRSSASSIMLCRLSRVVAP